MHDARHMHDMGLLWRVAFAALGLAAFSVSCSSTDDTSPTSGSGQGGTSSSGGGAVGGGGAAQSGGGGDMPSGGGGGVLNGGGGSGGCVPDEGEDCTTNLGGPCSIGTTACDGTCAPNQQPSAEICNGIDDECEVGGSIDEEPAASESCGPMYPNAESVESWMCNGGSCVPTCEPGFADTDNNLGNGCETEL